MEQERVLAEFRKNVGEVVRVSFTTYKGKKLVNLRVYYNAGEDEDEWRPSPKGLTLRRELIPELKEAVLKADREWEKELSRGEKEGQEESEEETPPF
jgi:hypothetical protein